MTHIHTAFTQAEQSPPLENALGALLRYRLRYSFTVCQIQLGPFLGGALHCAQVCNVCVGWYG